MIEHVRPIHAQNLDGQAHVTYYDKPTQLSFTFDGRHGNVISVARGGYSEPEIDAFRPTVDINQSLDGLMQFAAECKNYVTQTTSQAALVKAFELGASHGIAGMSEDLVALVEAEYAQDASGVRLDSYRSGRSLGAEVSAG